MAHSHTFAEPRLRLGSPSVSSPRDVRAASPPGLWSRRVMAPSFENDCACATAPAVPLAPPLQTRVSLPALQAAPDALVIPLRPGYRLLFVPTAPQGPVVLNDEGYLRWQAFARQPQPPSQPFDWHLWAAGLIWPEGQPPPRPQDIPTMLTVWLHLTDACNLDCPYCYVQKRPHHMSVEVAEQALTRLSLQARERGFRRLKLKYAGGEPTLVWKRLQAIHQRAVQRVREAGLELEAVLLTNGTRLNAARVRWLQEQGIRVALSLDGLGPLHDRLRPAHDGQSAFQRLAHAVDDILLPLGLRPSITITVTRWNAGALAETLSWVLERDLPFSLNFYRPPWNILSSDDLRLETQALIDGMRAAFQVLEQHLPTWPFLDGLMDRGTGLPHRHACGVGHSYLVVTPEGQVAPCHMRLDMPLGSAAAFHLHRLSQGPIRNLPVEQRDADCRTCPFRYLCAGGCPLEAFRYSGRWDGPNPYCTVYRTLYPAALRLEGLRLLKVHGLA